MIHIFIAYRISTCVIILSLLFVLFCIINKAWIDMAKERRVKLEGFLKSIPRKSFSHDKSNALSVQKRHSVSYHFINQE